MNYTTIEVRVVENGYETDVIYWTGDSSCLMEYVFSTREKLYEFLDPLLEIGTAKAGDEPEEWNHV